MPPYRIRCSRWSAGRPVPAARPGQAGHGLDLAREQLRGAQPARAHARELAQRARGSARPRAFTARKYGSSTSSRTTVFRLMPSATKRLADRAERRVLRLPGAPARREVALPRDRADTSSGVAPGQRRGTRCAPPTSTKRGSATMRCASHCCARANSAVSITSLPKPGANISACQSLFGLEALLVVLVPLQERARDRVDLPVAAVALRVVARRVVEARRDAVGSIGRSATCRMSVARNSSYTLRARWRLRLVGVVGKRFRNIGEVSTPACGTATRPVGPDDAELRLARTRSRRVGFSNVASARTSSPSTDSPPCSRRSGSPRTAGRSRTTCAISSSGSRATARLIAAAAARRACRRRRRSRVRIVGLVRAARSRTRCSAR